MQPDDNDAFDFFHGLECALLIEGLAACLIAAAIFAYNSQTVIWW